MNPEIQLNLLESIRDMPNIEKVLDDLLEALEYHPEQFSDEQINKLIKAVGQIIHLQDRARFETHLDRASEIVHSWPEWKQNILRRKPLR